jgi:hypothetical protein
MNSSGFAVALIVGIAMFATGVGGKIALVFIAIGGIGMVISAFSERKR